MKYLQIAIGIAFAVALAAFIFSHLRMARRSGRPTRSSRRPAPSHQLGKAFDSEQFLQKVLALRNRRAQWPEIFATLNPTEDEDVQRQLIGIRGPHMFDPHTALGVLEACARSAPKGSSLTEVLAAATKSMNTVVRFGA